MYIFKITLDGQTNTTQINPNNFILTALSETNRVVIRGNDITQVIDLGIERKFVTDFIKDFDIFLTSDYLKVIVDDNELRVTFRHEFTKEIVYKIYTN